ncbi:hypothetical protein QQG55_43600 [Brugia pahangi]|uniref:Protein FMC1 homolog n=1 Tax=Brugia pahangi TaxID=6280 RepID=A0A0N4TR05_BRUPA|nr:unnamed protein product [Brugia pahangi]
MTKWRNRAQAASLIRHVIEDFHKSRVDLTWKKSEKSFLKQKANIEQNKKNVLRNMPREEHLYNTYRHYLTSTMHLKSLQEQYKGGERSLEESARLVGLKIPSSKS